MANQLRWQLPWLARVTGRSLVRPVSWYQWQAQTSRAGTAWPARISRVVLAEHQGVYRYASWREVNAPWEAALIEALHPQASRGHTRP